MLEVLYEDNHLIAINKKAGDLVQGDKTKDETLADRVKQYIKKKYNKPGEVYLGITHRLDRPVSGVVIFARTSKALTRLNDMFKNKEVQKTYWAIVKEMPRANEETLTHYLLKNEKQNKSYASAKSGKGRKEASLTYRMLCRLNTHYGVEVELHTGRHHQIRCQLATIGIPIRGDLKYGFPRSNKDGSIHLHARKVEFIHPVKKEPVTITAKPPKDNLWNQLVEQTK